MEHFAFFFCFSFEKTFLVNNIIFIDEALYFYGEEMCIRDSSYTRALQNEKIAQREKLYQEAVAKSDAGAQLLIDELRQYPEQTLQQRLKLSLIHI